MGEVPLYSRATHITFMARPIAAELGSLSPCVPPTPPGSGGVCGPGGGMRENEHSCERETTGYEPLDLPVRVGVGGGFRVGKCGE